jgi:hypothetical protein
MIQPFKAGNKTLKKCKDDIVWGLILTPDCEAQKRFGHAFPPSADSLCTVELLILLFHT